MILNIKNKSLVNSILVIIFTALLLIGGLSFHTSQQQPIEAQSGGSCSGAGSPRGSECVYGVIDCSGGRSKSNCDDLARVGCGCSWSEGESAPTSNGTETPDPGVVNQPTTNDQPQQSLEATVRSDGGTYSVGGGGSCATGDGIIECISGECCTNGASASPDGTTAGKCRATGGTCAQQFEKAHSVISGTPPTVNSTPTAEETNPNYPEEFQDTSNSNSESTQDIIVSEETTSSNNASAIALSLNNEDQASNVVDNCSDKSSTFSQNSAMYYSRVLQVSPSTCQVSVTQTTGSNTGIKGSTVTSNINNAEFMQNACRGLLPVSNDNEVSIPLVQDESDSSTPSCSELPDVLIKFDSEDYGNMTACLDADGSTKYHCTFNEADPVNFNSCAVDSTLPTRQTFSAQICTDAQEALMTEFPTNSCSITSEADSNGNVTNCIVNLPNGDTERLSGLNNITGLKVRVGTRMNECYPDRTFEETEQGNYNINDSLFSIPKVSAQEAPPTPNVIDINSLEKGTYELKIPGYQSATVTIVTDNVKVSPFEDTNGNGIKDAGEIDVDAGAFQVQISKTEEIRTYSIEPGWNLIGIPFVSDTLQTASDVALSMAQQGIEVAQVSKYDSGNWIHYVVRLDENGELVEFGPDFQLVPGEGYFVRSMNSGGVLLRGNVFESGVPISLSKGWNLRSIQSQSDYTATSFLKTCATQQILCAQISKYENGLYDSVVEQNGFYFGNDFTLLEQSGYFIKVNNEGGSFTP